MHSRTRRVFTAGISLSILAACLGPAADAAPAPSGPSPVTPEVQDISLGRLPSGGTDLAAEPTLTVSKPDTEPFSSVGVTWKQDPALTGVEVTVRTKNPGTGAWSAWQQLEVESDTAPNPQAADTQRGGTSPYWTGPADGIEVSVSAPGGQAPKDLRLTLIDPKQSATDARLVPTPASGIDSPGPAPAYTTNYAAAPVVFSRQDWGADESLRSWDPEYAGALRATTVHHTADSNNYTAAQVPGLMRSIYYYQAVTKGWGDLGYNVVVDKFGRLWEGRYGGLDSTVIGAHAGGFNAYTFGVSMLGNYQDVEVPPQVMDAVAGIVAWKLALYGLNPMATTQLTQRGGNGTTAKFGDGTTVDLPVVFGHRDVGNTLCPGQYAYSRMDELRAMVAARMQPPTVFVRNANAPGAADLQVQRGMPGDRVVRCDWNADRIDSLGYFRRGDFYLFNGSAAASPADVHLQFGTPQDLPICGDWDGDGIDSIGVYRPSNQTVYLRNRNTSGAAEVSFAVGNPGDLPIAGDWDGDGVDTVGVYRAGQFFLPSGAMSGAGSGAKYEKYLFGEVEDLPAVGDWDGDGVDSIGVRRGDVFYLVNAAGRPKADLTIPFGLRSDTPLPGDWNGDRTDTIGVTR